MVDIPGIYWVFFSVNLHIIGFMFDFPSKSPENIRYNVRKKNVNHLKFYQKIGGKKPSTLLMGGL